jgi:hypothetical protein
LPSGRKFAQSGPPAVRRDVAIKKFAGSSEGFFIRSDY